FRRVYSPAFSTTVVILFFQISVVGGLLYPRYRIDVRSTLEDLQLLGANGLFEIKEHFAAIGLGLLPAYWMYWADFGRDEHRVVRNCLTWMLTFFAWWNFVVGEYLNNIKGLFP